MKRLEKKKRHKQAAANSIFGRTDPGMRMLLITMEKKPHGKWCTKCKSALVCTTKGVPPVVSRCPRCNTRFAHFHPQRNITWATPGVQRCPDRSALKLLDCPVCTGKMKRD